MGESKRRKLWIGLIMLLVAIELGWVIGANWALSSDKVIAKINHKPEKLEVEWVEARGTLFPGVIDLKGLSIRGQSRKQQWYVELDEGRVHMSLLALATKTLRIHGLDGSGLDFRLRKRQLPGDSPATTAEFAPEIPGLAVDEPPFPPKKKKAKKRPWKIDLHDIHIDEFEQLWILALRLTAEGSVDADLEIELGGGALSMDRVRMNLSGAELTAMGDPVLRQAQLGVDARMEPFVPKEVKGLQVLKSVSGKLNLSGESAGSTLIDSLLADVEEIDVGSPGGQVEGVLEVEKGVLVPGTEIAVTAKGGWVDLLDWRASGELSLQSTVAQADDEISTRLDLTLADVAFAAIEGGDPLLAGADLVVHVEAGELDISGGGQGLAAEVTAITMDLSNAHVADITRFPIPAVEDFTLDSGEVLVESHAVLTPGHGARATINVHGTGIGASQGEVTLEGDLSLDLQIATDDVRDRRFEFTDSTLLIDNVHIDQGKKAEDDWYLHLDMTEGWLTLKDPGEIVCSAEIKMRDTRPLIAILGQEVNIIRKLKGILDFKDLESQADIEIAANSLEIENVEIDSEGLKLRANLRIRDKKASGILYTKFHGIPFAVDMRGEKKQLHLSKPLQWYEAQTVPWAGRQSAPPTLR